MTLNFVNLVIDTIMLQILERPEVLSAELDTFLAAHLSAG